MIHREQRRQLHLKEWPIKYSFHLLSPAWGKCTVPWPLENGTQGNNPRGFVFPPPQPDGSAIGGRKGIFSNKVGCNVQAERDCWHPNSRHVTKVSLTPPDIAIEINMMPQTITPRADVIVYCGAKTLNSWAFGTSSALYSVISSDSKYACGCLPVDVAPMWKTLRSERRLDIRRSSTHSRWDKAPEWRFNRFAGCGWICIF